MDITRPAAVVMSASAIPPETDTGSCAPPAEHVEGTYDAGYRAQDASNGASYYGVKY